MSRRYLYKISCQVCRDTVGTSRRCMGMLELHVFLLANVMNNFCNFCVVCNFGQKNPSCLVVSHGCAEHIVCRMMLNTQKTTLVNE